MRDVSALSESGSRPERLGRPARRRARPSAKAVLGGGGSYLALAAVVLVFAIPFLWMVLTSFKGSNDVFRYASPLSWRTFLPPQPTIANYVSLFTTWHFQRDLLNTLIAAVGQVGGAVIVCCMAGFAFARLRFPGRNALFLLCMVTAFVPLEAVVVPLYNVARALHLVSTYPGLFLPFVFSPFGIFLMRQAFADVPVELSEAAKVDGASWLRILWSVELPNVRPGLVTLVLVQFMWGWNNFLWPLVVMQDPTKQVVQVTIAKFESVQNFPLYGELFAAASAATLPVLVLFILLQRYYVRGLLLSGLK